MAKLKVEIVTPEKRVLSVQADEAIVPGARGLFGVRPGHTPFLSLMEPGWMTLKDGATTQRYYLAGGFVEVANDVVRILADQAESEADVDLEAAKKRGTTTFHPSGTCRMGPASDPVAVVDDQLRVRGLEGLRVIDASIMPTMLSANLNAATLMIAEKASDILLGKTAPEPIVLAAS
jgi:F-type H+-transporting ATPase subunit epsilon